jgi:hypothetical protein
MLRKVIILGFTIPKLASTVIGVNDLAGTRAAPLEITMLDIVLPSGLEAARIDRGGDVGVCPPVAESHDFSPPAAAQLPPPVAGANSSTLMP